MCLCRHCKSISEVTMAKLQINNRVHCSGIDAEVRPGYGIVIKIGPDDILILPSETECKKGKNSVL